jgi:hypothetical protein
MPSKTHLTSRCLSTPPPKLRIIADAALILVQRFGTLFVFGTSASVVSLPYLPPVGTGVSEDRHHAGARVGLAAATLLASAWQLNMTLAVTSVSDIILSFHILKGRAPRRQKFCRALSTVIDGDPLSAPRLACASRDRNCARRCWA